MPRGGSLLLAQSDTGTEGQHTSGRTTDDAMTLFEERAVLEREPITEGNV